MMIFALESPDTQVNTEINSLNMIARLKKEAPNLILFDLWMPVLSGDHLPRQLRTDRNLKNLPVIVMSASQEGERIALEAGANAYLSKPFDIDSLSILVDKYLQHYH